MAAGRCADLEPLLCNPSWLEHKLHAYGVTSIVADFRRCRTACLNLSTLDDIRGLDACSSCERGVQPTTRCRPLSQPARQLGFR